MTPYACGGLLVSPFPSLTGIGLLGSLILVGDCHNLIPEILFEMNPSDLPTNDHVSNSSFDSESKPKPNPDPKDGASAPESTFLGEVWATATATATWCEPYLTTKPHGPNHDSNPKDQDDVTLVTILDIGWKISSTYLLGFFIVYMMYHTLIFTVDILNELTTTTKTVANTDNPNFVTFRLLYLVVHIGVLRQLGKMNLKTNKMSQEEYFAMMTRFFNLTILVFVIAAMRRREQNPCPLPNTN